MTGTGVICQKQDNMNHTQMSVYYRQTKNQGLHVIYLFKNNFSFSRNFASRKTWFHIKEVFSAVQIFK